MKKSIFIVCLLVVITSSFEVFSQGRKLYPGQTRTRMNSSIPISRKIAYPWTWTLGLGSTSYFGQLCEGGDCVFAPIVQPGFNNFQIAPGIRYRFTNRISVGVNFKFFRIGASDLEAAESTGRPGRGITFRTTGYEFNAYVMADIIPTISRFMGDKSDQYNRRNFFVPYVLAGAGVLYFAPSIKDPLTGKYESVVGLKTFEGKDYSNIVPTVYGGLGFRIKATEFIDVGADLTYTVAFTQYLDDLGGKQVYPTREGLNSTELWTKEDRLSAPGFYERGVTPNPDGSPAPPFDGRTQRSGKAEFFDGYGIFNIHINYTMANPVNFSAQKSHKHFKHGKGTKHHRFERK